MRDACLGAVWNTDWQWDPGVPQSASAHQRKEGVKRLLTHVRNVLSWILIEAWANLLNSLHNDEAK